MLIDPERVDTKFSKKCVSFSCPKDHSAQNTQTDTNRHESENRGDFPAQLRMLSAGNGLYSVFLVTHAFNIYFQNSLPWWPASEHWTSGQLTWWSFFGRGFCAMQWLWIKWLFLGHNASATSYRSVHKAPNTARTTLLPFTWCAPSRWGCYSISMGRCQYSEVFAVSVISTEKISTLHLHQ